MAETVIEEISRLRREIGERQMRLQFLVCGDPSKGVSGGPQPEAFAGLPEHLHPHTLTR